MPVSMILGSGQSVSITLRTIAAQSITLRTIAAQSITLSSVDPVLLVLGGGVAIIFSITQWQNITSQTWEATTQTWD